MRFFKYPENCFMHKSFLLRIIIFSLFIFLIFKTDISAQIKSVDCLTQSCRQYQKSEWKISLLANWTDPYESAQIALDMIIETPSGKKLTLPCFYLKGKSGQLSEWRARFTPTEIGAYTASFCLQTENSNNRLSDTIRFSVSSSGSKGFLHPNDFWTFKFDNGRLFRGIGQNICWEARKSDDSKFFKKWHENKKFNYADMLTELKKGGGNFFRTWMIYWNLPVDWKKPMNSTRYKTSNMRFNESGIKRMDELIQLCDSLEIYLMLALESHVGFTGSGWENSTYNKKNGGFAETPTDFFSFDKSRKQYKDKLRFMVARWGYSTSIAGWEFFNEIDNVIYSNPANIIPDSIITDWHTDMGTYLKEADPYDHFITTSISHRDVNGLNEIKAINFNQKHIYRNTKGIPGTIKSYIEKFNKPYVIGEFGFEWDWSKNFNDFADEMDSDFKRGLWYGLFSPTPVLPMSWWWEFFDKRNMQKYFANIQEMNRNILQSGTGNIEQISIQTGDSTLIAMGITNGVKNYAYIFNPGEKEIKCQIALSGNPIYQFSEWYDCESTVYNRIETNEEQKPVTITIPAKRDVVLIGIKK